MSTFITFLGLIALSVPCVLVALAGLFQMLFNNIGGNGTKWTALVGLLMLVAGAYALFSIWHNLSPLTITIDTAAIASHAEGGKV